MASLVNHLFFIHSFLFLLPKVLSSSVADAIQFLKDAGVPGFDDADGTIFFLRKIDQLFDLLNSRSSFGKGFKRPLSLGWIDIWTDVIDSSCHYLEGLTAPNGIPLKHHAKKTFIKRFLLTAQSTKHLVKWLLTREFHPFKYFLTYKLSQDHVELLFRCIRGKDTTVT